MDMMKEIKKNCTIPNLLTLLRIAVIIPMSRLILKGNYLAAGILLLISAVSDMFDGMIARRFNQITQLGKILDPIADKLTLIAIVICINVIYPYVYPFVIIMFAKEIAMLIGGAVLLKKKIKPPAAKWFGKVATAVFYVSMITLVGLKAIWDIHLSWLTTTLFSLTAALMIFSLLNYAIIFFQLLKENK